MIRSDFPTSSIVSDVQIWKVSEVNDTDFNVLFSVKQQLMKNKKMKNIDSTYEVMVLWMRQLPQKLPIFLGTFFKLYPIASEKELSYYVHEGVLPIVEKEYLFAELLNPVYTLKEDGISVDVTVEYLDQESNMTHLSQYNLILKKQENWKIMNQ